MSTELAPGTPVFETDFAGEAKFYAERLGPDFIVTAGIDTLYAVRVKQPDAVEQLETDFAGFVESIPPECSICRRRHGLEITHASE